MDKRLGSALAQYAHKQGHPVELAQAAQAAVEKSAPNLGPRSNSRKARLRLGKTLIDTQMHPEIWVPVCPDYSSDTNGYRFDALRSGVSLLARRHAAFLQPITKAVPGARVTVMYADLEARDRAIAQACGIDSITFLQRVDASIEATRRELRGRGGTWRVERMTDVIDNLPTRELAARRWLMSSPERVQRLERDAFARSDMYDRINPLMGPEERIQRTLRTSAQYVALGQEATKHQTIICGHTTTNLHWYEAVGAALLHNNVRLYRTPNGPSEPGLESQTLIA